jgi:hypothetical protein
MLVLVSSAECYVAKHAAKFSTKHSAAWKRSGDVVDKAARCGIVALGDSLVKHGVVSSVVAGRSERAVYNLAVPKGMFPAHDFLLRRLIGRGAKLEALFIDGEMLLEDPFANPRIWPELLSVAACAELAWEGREADFFTRMALAKALPSFRARWEIRQSVLLALEDKLPEDSQVLPILWRNWKQNAGSEVLADRIDPPGDDPRARELEQTHYKPSTWPLNRVNHVFVERFLNRARDQRLPVFWLLPPYHPDVEARRTRYGFNGHYVAYLEALVARYPNLTVIDSRRAAYPPEALADMTHLGRTGAIAFSDALGRLVRDRLARKGEAADVRSRWIELPRYDAGGARALAMSSDVEDLLGSSRALELRKAGVPPTRRERRLAEGPRPESGERRRR